jgi:hypothetical protein
MLLHRVLKVDARVAVRVVAVAQIDPWELDLSFTVTQGRFGHQVGCSLRTPIHFDILLKGLSDTVHYPEELAPMDILGLSGSSKIFYERHWCNL